MGHTISHNDQYERGSDAIDRIADGLKTLWRIWLARQFAALAGDQGETSGAIERETRAAKGMDGLMTLQEAAKFLNVTDQTVHAWRKRGIIEGLRFGEEWRFQRDELIEAGRKWYCKAAPKDAAATLRQEHKANEAKKETRAARLHQAR